VEHGGPPVAAGENIGNVRVGNFPALAITWRWGPETIPLVAETTARVRAGVYNCLSASLNPLEVEPIRGTRGVRIVRSELLAASIVKIPADPRAKITQRNFPVDVARLRRSLPRVPSASVARVLDKIGRSHESFRSVPFYMLPPCEQTRLIQAEHSRHCNIVWGLQRAAGQREYSLEQRRQDLLDLARDGTEH
jgi:hypothetical protein